MSFWSVLFLFSNTLFWKEGRFVFAHFWVIVHSIFSNNHCQLGTEWNLACFFHFCCNHRVFRVRFILVSRISLLCMEYRCDEKEIREDKKLPVRTFAIKFYIKTSLICGSEWLVLQSRWSVKVRCDRESTAGLPLSALSVFLVPVL